MASQPDDGGWLWINPRSVGYELFIDVVIMAEPLPLGTSCIAVKRKAGDGYVEGRRRRGG